jgi:hypothetical protein
MMSDSNSLFPIIEVSADAAQAEEAMGTKFKFWFQHLEMGNCLFKMARPNTGEDWSEKIASELCKLLGLPHARYELAVWGDIAGTISPSFLTSNTILLHGNDILASVVSNYPRDQGYKTSQHTLTNVVNALTMPGLKLPVGWNPVADITDAVSVFVGYLLLDAWIGNTDRHHENWGFMIDQPKGIPYLAPTYDHASCLGRELQDSKRGKRLQQKSIALYANKSHSAFFSDVADKETMLTFDAFSVIAKKYNQSAAIWLNRLESISSSDLQRIFQRIPGHRISSFAIDFSTQMLDCNKFRLLKLREDLG